MPRLAFAVPGGLESRTGGTIYDRKVAEALRGDGWWVDVLDWPGSFPFPNEDDRLAVAASLAALPDDALVMIDGLALGTLPGLARREAERLRLVALVHHPLALETGLSPMMAATFAAEERDALACVRAVIVTSQTTAAIVEGAFGAPAGKITVARPGVDRLEKPPTGPPMWPRPPRRPGPARILSVGAISPRKAHDVLLDALAGIDDLDWTCTIVGSLEREPEVAESLIAQRAMLGLASRVRLVGEQPDAALEALYEDADIFALASVFEGYGMVFQEAQLHGLPIVATTGGAIPEAIHPGAAVLVEPRRAEPFAEALRRFVEDGAYRDLTAWVSEGAGRDLPDWNRTAAAIASVLESL